MAKQTAKRGKGRKKVEVKDLSKTEKNLPAKQMKKVKGGQRPMLNRVNETVMNITRSADEASRSFAQYLKV